LISELLAIFPDQESGRIYIESRLWPKGVRCPVCGLGGRITIRKGGFYRCNQCKEDFTVRTGTIFERSHVPLHKWLFALYLVVTSSKGLSSMHLANQILVTKTTAWRMLKRLRAACGDNFEKLNRISGSTRPASASSKQSRSMTDEKSITEVGGDKAVRRIPKPPKILDKLLDLVLAHKPKAKSKAARNREKRAYSSRGMPRRQSALTSRQ
jgi:transposase-like protein